jgi:hypothetical protein
MLVFALTLPEVASGRTWELPIGIVALLAGLVTASFVAYRGRSR